MKPIIFNTEMVRAILCKDNPKTQTRRLIKPQPKGAECFGIFRGTRSRNKNTVKVGSGDGCEVKSLVKMPYSVGDILYVRETFYQKFEWRRDIDDELCK